MRNCDIKFVNKEITPFGGLSLFFKMLENAILTWRVMAYNFMSSFRHALINSNKNKFLKTIRYELLSTAVRHHTAVLETEETVRSAIICEEAEYIPDFLYS